MRTKQAPTTHGARGLEKAMVVTNDMQHGTGHIKEPGHIRLLYALLICPEMLSRAPFFNQRVQLDSQ